jgi:hypothetical protein
LIKLFDEEGLDLNGFAYYNPEIPRPEPLIKGEEQKQ